MLNIKQFTSSQNLLLNGLLSIAGTAALGAIGSGVQYVAQGHVSFPALTSLMIAAFCGLYGASLKAYIPPHIATIMTAKDDTLSQAQGRIAALELQLQDKAYIQQALAFLKANPPAPASPADVSQQVVNALAPLLQAQPVNVTIAQPTPVIPQPIAPTALSAPIAVQPQDNTPVQRVTSLSDAQAQPVQSAQPATLPDTSDVLHFPVVSQQMPAVQGDPGLIDTTKLARAQG